MQRHGDSIIGRSLAEFVRAIDIRPALVPAVKPPVSLPEHKMIPALT